jgi:hypothetical protein
MPSIGGGLDGCQVRCPRQAQDGKGIRGVDDAWNAAQIVLKPLFSKFPSRGPEHSTVWAVPRVARPDSCLFDASRLLCSVHPPHLRQNLGVVFGLVSLTPTSASSHLGPTPHRRRHIYPTNLHQHPVHRPISPTATHFLPHCWWNTSQLRLLWIPNCSPALNKCYSRPKEPALSTTHMRDAETNIGHLSYRFDSNIP